MPDRNAESGAYQAEPQRYSLRRHRRERHGRPPMLMWASMCRWCQLRVRLEAIADPATASETRVLRERVTALEHEILKAKYPEHIDGKVCG